MKHGLYVGSRAGATCAGPADPVRIARLVDDLAGGRPFVIREYVRWCGGDTELEREIGACGDLDGLTMPDEWYVTGGRRLDLVLSYLFALSDADSASGTPLGTFGLCTGDYTPKPAYAAYRAVSRRANCPDGSGLGGAYPED